MTAITPGSSVFSVAVSQEPVERMEEHPAENRAFRMARAVDSRHIRESRSRNAPGLRAQSPVNRRLTEEID